MRARRDQVQAYRFVTRRIVAAMLSGEPETTDRPMRRLGLSVFASSMVAVLGMAAFGIWGLVTGQTSDLVENTLVIEKESQARYVYIDDGNGTLRLHPVLNYTSARLVLGAAEPTEATVSASALEDLPRGPTLGIRGAPDSRPAPEALVALPWSICSVPPEEGSLASPTTWTVIGRELTGGTPLGQRGLYVSHGDDDYLLWNDMQLRMVSQTARVVTGLANTTAVSVPEQLLNAITAGPNLGGLSIEGRGELSEYRIEGERSLVGWVYRAGGQHYILTRDGLLPVGEFAAELRIATGVPVHDISTSAVDLDAAPGGRPLEPEGYPESAPEIYRHAGSTTTICAIHRGGETGALGTTIEVFDSVPDELALAADSAIDAVQTDEDIVATVDRILSRGQGALVRAAPTANTADVNAAVYLITPEGRRYPLTDEAVAALDYGEVEPTPIPAALLEMIPRGPSLDPDHARAPVAWTTENVG